MYFPTAPTFFCAKIRQDLKVGYLLSGLVKSLRGIKKINGFRWIYPRLPSKALTLAYLTFNIVAFSVLKFPFFLYVSKNSLKCSYDSGSTLDRCICSNK